MASGRLNSALLSALSASLFAPPLSDEVDGVLCPFIMILKFSRDDFFFKTGKFEIKRGRLE